MTISELLATIEPRLAVGRAAPAPYRALDAFDRSIDLDPASASSSASGCPS